MSLVSKKTFEFSTGGYVCFEYIRRGNPSAVTDDYVKITEWFAFVSGVKQLHERVAKKARLHNDIATPYVKCKSGDMIVMFLDTTDAKIFTKRVLLELGYIEK